MANPDDTTDNDYNAYAQFCLKLATQTPDRPSRLMLREMAAQWLSLSDSAPTNRRYDGHDGRDSPGNGPDGGG